MASLGLATGDSKYSDCSDLICVYHPKVCCPSVETAVKFMASVFIVFSIVEICIAFGICYPLWSQKYLDNLSKTDKQSTKKIIAFAGMVAIFGVVRIASLVNVLRSLKNQNIAKTIAARGFCLCCTMSAMILSVLFGAYLKSILYADIEIPKYMCHLYLCSISLDVLFAILYGFCVIEHYRSDVIERNQIPSITMRHWAGKDNAKYAHNLMDQDQSV